MSLYLDMSVRRFGWLTLGLRLNVVIPLYSKFFLPIFGSTDFSKLFVSEKGGRIGRYVFVNQPISCADVLGRSDLSTAGRALSKVDSRNFVFAAPNPPSASRRVSTLPVTN